MRQTDVDLPFVRRTCARVVALCLLAALGSGCGAFGGFPDPFTIANLSLTEEQGETLLAGGDKALPGLIDDHHATSNEPRCYYSFPDSGDRANDYLRCGPVRAYGEPADATWLKMGVYNDGEGRARIAKGSSGGDPTPEPPTALADGEELKRPDGEEPADADNVAEPQPRRGKPGHFTTTRAAGGLKLEKPKEAALLLSPDASLALTGLGTGDVFGTGSAAVKSAKGEEFVYARVDTDPTYETATKVSDEGVDHGARDEGEKTESPEPSETAEPTEGGEEADGDDVTRTLVTGSTRHELDDDLADGTVIAVSVRKGEDAELELTDHGKKQTLDLRTGKRSSDPVFAPLYREANTQEIAKPYRGSATNYREFGTVSLSVDVDEAALVPYVEDKGYAPAGKAWLVVAVTEQGSSSNAEFLPSTYRFTVDGKDSTISDVPAGSVHFLVTAVSADLTTATFTVQGKGRGGGNVNTLTTPFTMSQKLSVPLSFPN